MCCGRAWLGGPQQKEEVPGCCYDDFPVCCCRSFCLERMDGGGWRVKVRAALGMGSGAVRYGMRCDAMLEGDAMGGVGAHGGERASERCGVMSEVG